MSPAASQDSADVARVRTELDVVGDTAVAVVWQLLDRMALRADNQVHHAETWVTQRETWLREGNRNDPPA